MKSSILFVALVIGWYPVCLLIDQLTGWSERERAHVEDCARSGGVLIENRAFFKFGKPCVRPT